MATPVTLGLIVGTRGIFNSALARTARRDLCSVLDELGYAYVILPETGTPSGAVETLDDARKCAALFQQNRATISGIIISLPNFGDELGVVNALASVRLSVPVLVQACDDEIDKVGLQERRDAFCGKLSVCNNLVQYGIPFTDTTFHTCAIRSDPFRADIGRFAAVCRVVNGLRNARIGAIGTRPGAFQTMRISEKLLQASGITVVPVDLSEIMARARQLDDRSAAVTARIGEIRDYGTVPASITADAVARQAKLSCAVESWMMANDLQAAGVQCWTSVEENYGCAACVTMSMLGERLIPCACEVDIGGVVAMYALTLATGNPSALLDWNNNYGDDRDKCVCTHCSNYPRSFVGNPVEIANLDVLGASLGAERSFGAVKGKVKAGPFTFFRVSTDDAHGRVRAYLGTGEFTDDPFGMAGGIAVCHVPGLQQLMKHLCRNGFEHHVAMVRSHCRDVIEEAVTSYLKWDLHVHRNG